MANLNIIKRAGEQKKTRVGRGGKRGKTSGRGTKGQNARAGHKKRPEFRDIIKKLPKRRGYGKNRAKTVVGSRVKPVAISIARLDASFEAGEITPHLFAQSGIVKGRGIKFPEIKIVSGGETSKKFVLKGINVSAAARATIEKAGGSIAPLDAARSK